MTALGRTLAIALLLGMVLLGYGAAVHPMLAGGPESQLRTIADTPHWRTMHLLMLAGSGLIIAGIWVRLVTDRSAVGMQSPRVPVARPSMRRSWRRSHSSRSVSRSTRSTSASWPALGRTWPRSSRRAARSRARVRATHPIGLVAARFGNFIVSLGALALGWASAQDLSRPRWLAWLAWAAAARRILRRDVLQ